jgi:uncharacterized protein (UPF0303 family)
MTTLPAYTVARLQAESPFALDSFCRDDAITLGLLAVADIREYGWNLAVRVVYEQSEVFIARLGSTGPDNDIWLAGKAAVAERFRESSLLVRRRHDENGEPFDTRNDIDHDAYKAYGGSIPILVGGTVVGTLTTSGEEDVIDHQAATTIATHFNEWRRRSIS